MKSVEVVAQAHLQTVPDVIQRTIDSDLEVLLCCSRKLLKLSSRKPRREVFHYKSRSVGEIALSP
jgi:hypothetical protein